MPSLEVLAAPWCRTSRRLLHELSREQVSFRAIDPDSSPGRDLRSTFAIEGLPAAIVREPAATPVVLRQPQVGDILQALGRSGDRRPPLPCRARPLAFDAERAAMPPRDYQVELGRALSARSTPGARLLLSVAVGAGKTRLAVDWVVQHVLARGGRALWVSRHAGLVRQAAADLFARHREAPAWAGRLGLRGALPELSEDPRRSVVFSTVQTCVARLSDRSVGWRRFSVLIIDEVHWGEAGQDLRALLLRVGPTSTCVGLTGTPRAESAFELVEPVITLQDLIARGLVARPIIVPPIPTGVAWVPRRFGATGDLTALSLGELARNAGRNELIARTIAAHAWEWRKVLVFAVDVAHCQELARGLRAKGVAAEYVHSRLAAEDREAVLARFTAAASGVLISVALLIHGVDIPDIDTLVLARPTCSKILFMQQLGRGVRLAPGKTTFNVVSFEDTVERHRDVLVDAPTFFGEQTPRRPRRARGPSLERHEYEQSPIVTLPSEAGYEALAGLDCAPRTTFGVEVELTTKGFQRGDGVPPDFDRVAGELLAALREALGAERVDARPIPRAHPGGDCSRWQASFDGTCGYELQSRVLRGEAGLEELHDALRALAPVMQRNGLLVDERCGLHVHLGYAAGSALKLRRLAELVSYFEPALRSLVAPSRWANPYALPLGSRLGALQPLTSLEAWRAAWTWENRYCALNLNPLLRPRRSGSTVEVRLHSGSTNPLKIALWVSIWSRILDAVERGRGSPGEMPVLDVPLAPAPRGDVLALLAHVGGSRSLAEAAVRRRDEVVEGSWARSTWRDLVSAVRPTWARLP